MDVELGGAPRRVGQAVYHVELHHGKLVIVQHRPEQELHEPGLVLKEERHVLVVHERQSLQVRRPTRLDVEDAAFSDGHLSPQRRRQGFRTLDPCRRLRAA